MESRIAAVRAIAAAVEAQFPLGAVALTVAKQYVNMREKLDERPEVLGTPHGGRPPRGSRTRHQAHPFSVASSSQTFSGYPSLVAERPSGEVVLFLPSGVVGAI